MKKPYAIQIDYCVDYMKVKKKIIPSYNEDREERVKEGIDWLRKHQKKDYFEKEYYSIFT